MAAAQPTVTLPKYGGNSMDNWTAFESLFRSAVDVTNIRNNKRVGFLKVRLKDAALQFFRQKHEGRLRIDKDSLEKPFL